MSGGSPPTGDYVRENAASRARLEKLASRLEERDFARRVSYGWTIAAALAHLAFWDYDRLALLTLWEREGYASPGPSAEHVNDALRPLIELVPGREAIRLALAAAEAVDRKVAGIAPELAKAIEGGGDGRALLRFVHRNEHLDDIERALAGA